MTDNVNHPNHYTQSGVECIDFIRDMISPFSGVVAGDFQNVLKYTWRAHDKNGVEDIKKARWYMKHAIQMINKHGMSAFLSENGEDMISLRSYNAIAGKEQVLERLPEKERPFYRIVTDSLISDNLSFPYCQNKAIEALDDWEAVFEGKKKSEEKNVNHPAHYADGKIECIDYLEAMVHPYAGIVAGCVQNALKYTWRSHGKNGVEDIEKAIWYLKFADKEINHQMAELDRTGQLLSLHPAFPKFDKIDKSLCEAGYQQVVEGLPTPEEKNCYMMLYNSLKDGRFTEEASCRKNAIKALEEWVNTYRKDKNEVKDIAVEVSKDAVSKVRK